MNRRRIARILAVVFVVTSGLIAFLPAPSSAEAPQATGYWSRRLPFQGSEVSGQSARPAVRYRASSSPQQELPPPTLPVPTTLPGGGPITTVPLPVPVPTIPTPPITLPVEDTGAPNPGVPDGGLWVANDPTGPVAISAIRYRGDIGSGELILKFAPGSTTVGPVVACPALSTFEPVAGGAWADRPAHDCERMSLSGRLLPDSSGLEFTIPQGFLPFGQRVLDIVLLPDRSSGDLFSLYFQKPDAESLVVTQGQELPPPDPELPEPAPESLPEVPSESSFDSGTTEFTDLPVSDDVAAPEPTDLGDGAAAPTPIADILEPFIESRTGRIIAVAILLGMGAGLWYFGGQPVRHPQLLGALAGDTPAMIDQGGVAGRGIGRFQKVRVAPPGRL
jgi:hypothetical protein